MESESKATQTMSQAMIQINDGQNLPTPFTFVTEEMASQIITNQSILVKCAEKVGSTYLTPWRQFTFWCLAIIIPIGLIMNFISIGVYTTSWMRRGVPGRYFIALSIADNLVLTGELLLWLNTNIDGPILGLSFIHQYDFFCKSIHFLRYGARMWSSWITVAITIERFLTVTFPLKMVRISSPQKAVFLIVTIGIICFSLGTFPFFTLEAKPYKGTPLCQFSDRKLYAIWTSVVIAIFGEMVIPSLIVSVFTAMIIWRLAIARRERLLMVEGTNHNQPQHWRQKASERQPTIALLAIAIMFVIIRMPYIVTFFINEYKDEIWTCLDKWQSLKIYGIYTVAKVFAVLNYAINFCLYCLSGALFRKELKKCITCKRWQPQCGPRTGSYVMSTRSNANMFTPDRSPNTVHTRALLSDSPRNQRTQGGEYTDRRPDKEYFPKESENPEVNKSVAFSNEVKDLTTKDPNQDDGDKSRSLTSEDKVPCVKNVDGELIMMRNLDGIVGYAADDEGFLKMNLVMNNMIDEHPKDLVVILENNPENKIQRC